MPQTMISVFVVDDQPLFRKGLRDSLDEASDVRLAGECATSDQAIELVESAAPSVVLVDASSPHGKGLDLARRLAQLCPTSAVIVMTAMPDDAELFEVMRLGAAAYLSKQATAKEIIAIIQRVCRGDFPLNESLISHPRVAERVLAEFQNLAGNDGLEGVTVPLSRREMEVLGLVRDGCINKEIAQRLCVTEQTVKSHVTSILRKLDVNDRTQAVLTAVRQGWMTLKREELSQSGPVECDGAMKALVVVSGDTYIRLWLPWVANGNTGASSNKASSPTSK